MEVSSRGCGDADLAPGTVERIESVMPVMIPAARAEGGRGCTPSSGGVTV